MLGTKSLSETMLTFCQLRGWEQISMKFLTTLIQENWYENGICKRDAISWQPSYAEAFGFKVDQIHPF